MILIVGGIASGKRTFAAELGYPARDMADAVIDDRPALRNAQELVRHAEVEDVFPLLMEKDLVIAEEVGSGVVPATHEDRAWRDRAGHLSMRLAEHADAVVRMVCGIPVVLKGDPWVR
jgi:adenosyl cobinamide kinase/adenosyl cobinamide phosphate guanylyltransferase